jgi:iron complex transport system ATP-binding protein
LNGVSFPVEKGKLTVLIGQNGSGKTTLLSAANGETAYSGEIRLEGQDMRGLSPRERSQKLAFLPQLLRGAHMEVEELTAMGRAPYWRLGKRLDAADRVAIDQALLTVGMEEMRHRRVDCLSGGERQRAYLAMTLAQQTPLLLLDEPTTYMDPAFAHTMIQQLCRLRDEEGKTLLVVMHDLNAALRCADNVAVLRQGDLAFFGTREECLAREAVERIFAVRRFEAQGRIFFEGD